MQKLSFEKGDIIKFICGDQKINDAEVIHIDRNITNSIEEGDKLVIDSSGCILKVLKIDYYRKEKQYNLKEYKEAKSFSNLPIANMNKNNNEFSADENDNKNNSHQQENLFWEKNKLFNTDDDESIISSSFGYQNNSSSNLNSAYEIGLNKDSSSNFNFRENNNKEINNNNKNFELKKFVQNSGMNMNNILLGNDTQSEGNNELGENDNIILCGNIESNISPIAKSKVVDRKIKKNLNLNVNNCSTGGASNNTSGKNLRENQPIIELIDEESKNEEKHDTPFFDVDHNFNSDAEETYKNKQNKITEVYKSIVKKHVSCKEIGIVQSKFGEKEERRQINLKTGN